VIVSYNRIGGIDGGMMPKLNPEFVRAAFAAEGYRLLNDYENAHKPIAFICPQGHDHRVSWTNFQSGSRCACCVGKAVKPETVRTAFEVEGYVMLGEYENARKPLQFVCPEGHHHQISWSNFRKGARCAVCMAQKTTAAKIAKFGIAVKAAFEAEGYELLEDYRRGRVPMRFICPNGHRRKISWDVWLQGRRCGVCAKEKSDAIRVARVEKEIKQAFAAVNWTLLSEFKNNSTPLQFICSEGHHHQIYWPNFRTGVRCGVCAGRNTLSDRVVRLAFEAEGYTLLDEYIDNARVMRFVCPEGHQHQISWSNFQQGNRCAVCSGRILAHETVQAAFEAEGYTLLDEYKRGRSYLKFICPRGHHHQMSWDSFNQGNRCRLCAGCGYSPSRPGRLYYLRFDVGDGKVLWKIGITNRTIAERFEAEKTPYTVLSDELWEDGRIALMWEKAILEAHKAHQYKGPKVLIAGNTECFTIDVLGRDGKRKPKRLEPTTQLSIPIPMAV
jgi:ribosomal protein S27E